MKNEIKITTVEAGIFDWDLIVLSVLMSVI